MAGLTINTAAPQHSEACVAIAQLRVPVKFSQPMQLYQIAGDFERIRAANWSNLFGSGDSSVAIVTQITGFV